MKLLDPVQMSAAPLAILDVLNSLLEAQLNSIFRFMDESSPYLSRADAEIRQPLQDMVATARRHAQELADLIHSLGGFPRTAGIQLEEQYLAFLSLKFLLPKLVDAKKLMIQRYENALSTLSDAPPEVRSVLEKQLDEHAHELAQLEKAAVQAAKG